MKKTILITGASSGIGKAAAFHFARLHWNVIAAMRNPEAAADLSAEPDILVTKLDVTDPESIDAAIQAGIDAFGGIDVLVNNAGYGQQGLFEAIPPEKIQAQFDVNVFGLMNVTRAILPHFRSRKAGTIINMSSAGGRITLPLMAVYCASKFAVEGFTEALAYELESQNIRVKLVVPGNIPTSFSQRALAEFAYDPSLTDYSAFHEEVSAFYQAGNGATLFTAEDVAEVVFTAANDSSHQLRYLAGPDIEPLIHMRNNGQDQAYVDTMRGIFRPGAFQN